MMMRMLEVGGMPVLTDDIRQADADNPNGYYEFEPVKRLRRDTSWLVNARGKAVKIVYVLLYDLPELYEYKIILMNRHLAEIIASQDAMLHRLGKNIGRLNTADWVNILEKDLDELKAWLHSRKNFTLLNVNYNSVTANPRAVVSEIGQFLDFPLDLEAMARIFDVALYRQRR
jgi:hypothetical protein